MLKRIILLVTIFSSLLFANKNVIAEAKLDAFELKDRSLKNVQKTLLREAKLKAANKLFGEVISSKTFVENGKLLEDYIYAAEGGVLHIKGDPVFENGDKLGEQKVMIMAYATDEDLDAMTLKKIELKDFTYANDELGLKQLKQAAQDYFVLEAIAKKNPGLKTQKNGIEAAKKLAMNVQIDKLALDVETASYKVSGFVEYIPAFVQNKGNGTATSSVGSIGTYESKDKQIVYDKANLTIYSDSGNVKEFKVDYKGGFILNKKATKFIYKENKKNVVNGVMNVKLLVPDNVDTDTQEISITTNEPTYYNYNSDVWYTVHINGSVHTKEAESEVSTYIINDTKYRYINVSIRFATWVGYAEGHFERVVAKKLANMKFSFSDSEKQAKVFHFKYNDSKFEEKFDLVVNSGSSKQKIFKIGYDNGFMLNKKSLKHILQENKKHVVTATLNGKLYLPDDIKSESINIKANMITHYNYNSDVWYYARINGSDVSKDLGQVITTSVLNENGKKYVNFSLEMRIWTGYSKPRFGWTILNRIGNLNFMVSDEDGEKWYSVYPAKHTSSKTKLVVNSDTGKQKEYLIDYTSGGFLIDQKPIKHIYQSNKKSVVTGTISTKFYIPDEIESENITIKTHEPTYYNYNNDVWYYARVNNSDAKNEFGQTIATHVINENGKKFVNVSIEFRVWKGYSESRLGYVVLSKLNNLSFMVSDENGEVWYPLIASEKYDKTKEVKSSIGVYDYKNDKEMKLFKQEKLILNENSLNFSNKLWNLVISNNAKKVIWLESDAIQFEIPNEISSSQIMVKANQKTNYNYNSDVKYWISINGSEAVNSLGQIVNTTSKTSNGKKVVNINFKARIWKGYAKDRLGYVINNKIGTSSFMVSEDGEKWYALKPVSK